MYVMSVTSRRALRPSIVSVNNAHNAVASRRAPLNSGMELSRCLLIPAKIALIAMHVPVIRFTQEVVGRPPIPTGRQTVCRRRRRLRSMQVRRYVVNPELLRQLREPPITRPEPSARGQ